MKVEQLDAHMWTFSKTVPSGCSHRGCAAALPFNISVTATENTSTAEDNETKGIAVALNVATAICECQSSFPNAIPQEAFSAPVNVWNPNLCAVACKGTVQGQSG